MGRVYQPTPPSKEKPIAVVRLGRPFVHGGFQSTPQRVWPWRVSDVGDRSQVVFSSRSGANFVMYEFICSGVSHSSVNGGRERADKIKVGNQREREGR